MVGLVAQDGAAGMVGDDCGDAHQARADRLGLPGAGGGVGQGEQLGEGQQACGPGPRSGLSCTVLGWLVFQGGVFRWNGGGGVVVVGH